MNKLIQPDCDRMTVNKISLEEYRYAVILTDSISDLIWENGLKTDDQISAAPKKSHSDTAPLRQKSKLITIMRDNAGEDYSHEIEKYIQSKDGGGDRSPQDRRNDRFGDKMIYQHSAVDYERRGKEQHKGAMAMVTNNSAKEEGIRTSTRTYGRFGTQLFFGSWEPTSLTHFWFLRTSY